MPAAPTAVAPAKLSAAERFETKIRSDIIRLMSTYGPRFSITMIGIHVRPYGAGWRDVFEEMVRDGTILRETQNVKGRIVFIHTLAPDVARVAV